MNEVNSDFLYIKVEFITGWSEPLLYMAQKNKVEHFSELLRSGSIILLECPFRKSKKVARVVELLKVKPASVKFKIREIDEIEILVFDQKYSHFLESIQIFFGVLVKDSLAKLSFLETKKSSYRDQKNTEVDLKEKLALELSILTTEQKEAFEKIQDKLVQQTFFQFLVHGVTGSGKSKIYLSLILQQLNLGKSVLFLVPEINLAVNFYNFFKKELRFFENIFAWHAGVKSAKEKSIFKGIESSVHPCLVVGVHLPIYLPISNLGLIIVDEEHEEAFRDSNPPFLDTKQIAALRAREENIGLILGSATPSLSTYHKAVVEKNYASLMKRFSSNLPSVSFAKISFSEKPYWFCSALKKEVSDVLAQRKQILVFLNRKGYASFLKCKSCLSDFKCPNCSVGLTFYKKNDGSFLGCSYCLVKIDYPAPCSECKKSESFLFKGLGIDQVTLHLQKIFPDSKILSADAQEIVKRDWGTKLKDFHDGKYDILVGTKTITKGLHFPNLTLSIALIADLDLGFPIYNINERVVQQIIQVGGRSGRSSSLGRVIVQAFRPDFFKNFLDETSYDVFLKNELEMRQYFKYPPFSKLIFIQTQAATEEVSLARCEAVLSNIKSKNFGDIEIFGPSKPIVHKKNTKFYYQIMIKVLREKDLKKVLMFLAKLRQQESLHLDFWLEV